VAADHVGHRRSDRVAIVIIVAMFFTYDPNAYQQASGKILSPIKGQTLDRWQFDAAGTANDVRRGVSLWLIVEIGGNFWPKESPVQLDANGQWKHTINQIGETSCFALSLWAVNKKTDQAIIGWLAGGQAAQDFPPLKFSDGAKRLATIERLQIRQELNRNPAPCPEAPPESPRR
jgi:hypothetical protein